MFETARRVSAPHSIAIAWYKVIKNERSDPRSVLRELAKVPISDLSRLETRACLQMTQESVIDLSGSLALSQFCYTTLSSVFAPHAIRDLFQAVYFRSLLGRRSSYFWTLPRKEGGGGGRRSSPSSSRAKKSLLSISQPFRLSRGPTRGSFPTSVSADGSHRSFGETD